MKITIGLIEDRGISKTLHFSDIGGNKVKGYIVVSENHPWYSKEVQDEIIISDLEQTHP